MVSILLPVLLALSGAGFYMFNWYIEPDFSDGQFYTSAWLEYGVNQNTLNIEYVADAKGACFPAIGEAMDRLYRKAGVNSKIDGKPVLIILYLRDKTKLVESGRMVVTAKEAGIILRGTPDERRAVVAIVNSKTEVTYNESSVMIEEGGVIKYVQFDNMTMNPNALYRRYLEEHSGE